MTEPATLGSAPPVTLDKVVWRVDSAPYQRGQVWVARYVPYVTAAIVADLLDSWVGPFNWEDDYERVEGRAEALVCSLRIRAGEGSEWIIKKDVGVSPGGNQEMATKGTYSDAFKRAASLKWGVARNVYLMPSLWAVCRVTEKEGKQQAYPMPEAQAELVQQLRQLGWETEGFRVAGDDDRTPDVETDDTADE